MRPGRPAPVVTHLRRPFTWLAVAFIVLPLLVGLAVVDARGEERRLDRSIDVEGTLVDRRTGDGMARVRFVHPVTEQELTLAIPVWDRSRLPAAPGPVRLDADPDDPEGVRLDGDVYEATGSLGWDLPYLALPVAIWVRRRWSVHRTERIMAGAGPSFAMLGAIRSSGWWGRRTELHLWPLDAAPGSPSLCRVGLLATSYLPIGGSVFTVEVKGRPRPFARVVARSPETGGVLWPAGAGLPRGARPRPAAAVVPAPLPAEVGDPPPNVRRVRPPRAPLATGLVLLAAGGLVLAAATVLTVRGGRQAHVVQEGPRVVAEVVEVDEVGDRLDLAYSRDGERRTGRAPVDNAVNFPVGRRYPATIDPADPARLRLVKSPYDPVAPIVWAGLVPLGGLLVLGWAFRRWLHAIRLARKGGWRPFEMWTGTDTNSWATLVPPRTGAATCSAHLGLPGVDGPPPTHTPVNALVAGDPQPGGRIVLHFSGTTRSVHRVGAAPRLTW